MECPSCEHPNVENARFCAKCGALLPSEKTDDADPLIGTVINNKYRVVRLLGEGGMGRVYEGEQPMGQTTRKVAIKTLHKHLSKEDPTIEKRFTRECDTVAALEHPNTIMVFDSGRTPDDGSLFVVMEFIKGRSIEELIETEGALPPDRVKEILEQVCGSLSEAHGKGIVHRDLKPENIVLTERAGKTDFVKVLDFGIAATSEASDAKKVEKLTKQGMVVGTPPYMSPEQFSGKQLDCRSDIYSLGVMAYEMLTAKLPFHAETAWEWATKHLMEAPYPFEREDVQSATQIPATMKQAIMRALSKNREDRQPDVMAFFDELSAGVASAPKTAVSASLSGRSTTGTTAMEAVPVGAVASHAIAPTVAVPMVAGPVPMPVPVYAGQEKKSGGIKLKTVAFIILGLIAVIAFVAILVAVRDRTATGGGDEQDTLTIGGPVTTAEPPIVPETASPTIATTVEPAIPVPTYTATTTAVATTTTTTPKATATATTTPVPTTPSTTTTTSPPPTPTTPTATATGTTTSRIPVKVPGTTTTATATATGTPTSTRRVPGKQ